MRYGRDEGAGSGAGAGDLLAHELGERLSLNHTTKKSLPSMNPDSIMSCDEDSSEYDTLLARTVSRRGRLRGALGGPHAG
jgi:hypothetical protein